VRAQINHMAMVNPNWPMMGRFYEAMFGFKTSGKVSRPANGISVGDGYVGLNINPMRDGYIGGLDHFGMVVDDIEEARARMQRKFPKANVFDLAEPKSKMNEIYADQQEKGGWAQDRYLNKFAIRTPNAEASAEFFHEVFDLQLVNKAGEKEGFYLSDGRVTLALLPWSIPIFEGMAIKRPGPDHIGVKVESIEAFKETMRTVAGSNPYLAPMPLGGSKESDARRDFLQRACGGKMQIADPGAVWIDITDE
jgi:catechol 2,3-dioxygenase-like lactoylglutathione lyase family enzyme